MKDNKYHDSWRWTKREEKIVHSYCRGSILHLCSGKSKMGDIRMDLYQHATIKADVLHLPFKSHSFDTIVCDPPWNMGFIARFWRELKRVAKRRIIVISWAMMNETRVWRLKAEKIIKRGVFQVKILAVYEKSGQDILKWV